MKKTLNLRKILLIVFGFLFVMSAAAFGLSLAKVSAADFDESDPSTYISSGESETFTYEDGKYVFASVAKETRVTLSIKQETIAYFKTLTQYDTLRITASLSGTDGTTIGYLCKGYDSTWGWTGGGQPLSRDFEIAGFADDKFDVTVCYGSSGSGSGFAVALELIEAPDYSDSETWFGDYNSDVTHTKAGYNSYNFTRSDNGGVLSFKGEALAWLVKKGYTKIRVTYIPNNAASGTEISLYPDGEAWNTNPVWANSSTAQTKEFDITSGSAFTLYCAKTPSITEFNIKLKAVNDDYNEYDEVINWFSLQSGVTCTQISGNSFDFEKSDNGAFMSFKAEALAYLVDKGYEAIRVTYLENNASSSTTVGIMMDGDNGYVYTNGTVKSRERDITDKKKFYVYHSKNDKVTSFNLKIEAVDYDLAENWFSTFDGVTCNKVNESSFDFERSDNGGVISFKANALAYLANKGYDVIRVTYMPNNAATGAEISLYPDGEAWNTNPVWANNSTAQTKEFDITSGNAFSVYCVKTDSITSFNLKIEAVDTDIKEVTVNYNVNGTLDNSKTIAWDEENFSANMPTVSVADVKTFGYEYDGKLYKDVSSVFAAIGTPESTVTVNVIALRLETQDGAEIRASGTAGLRFTSIVGQSEYFSEFGMILTVRSNVDTNSENTKAVGIDNFDKESLSAASLKYIELVSTSSGFNSYEQNGNTVFNLVLTNISEAHLTMQYIARTYVTVKYADGTTVTYYSDVDFENNARAPQDVGYSALDNAELSGITEDQKAFIRENYLSKKA